MPKDATSQERASMNRIGGSIRNPPHVPVVDILAADHLAASGFRYPTFGKDFLAFYNASIHEEQSKPTIVTQGGTQATSPNLLPVGRFKPPRGVRLHAKL